MTIGFVHVLGLTHEYTQIDSLATHCHLGSEPAQALAHCLLLVQIRDQLQFPVDGPLDMRPFTTGHIAQASSSPGDSCATHAGEVAAAPAATGPSSKRSKPSEAAAAGAACGAQTDAGLYRLQCVIEHIGRTLHGGHYVSYVRCGQKWLKCDDQKITEVRLITLPSAAWVGAMHARHGRSGSA